MRKVRRVLMDLPARLDLKDRRVCKVRPDLWETMESKARWVPQDPQDHKARQVVMVLQDLPDLRDLKDYRVWPDLRA